MTTPAGRTARWVAFWLVLQGLAGSWGLWQAYLNDQHVRNLIHSEDAEEVVESAVRCVTAWEAREDVRDMAENVYRSNAETLIGLSTTADPARIDQYRELVERDVAAIRAELPDPDCDLEASRRLVEQPTSEE